MRSIINHLIQLQELTLIRDEQRALYGQEHMQSLNESIVDMTQKLPGNLKTTFERLHKKDHIVIAPMSAETCSVCGMRLPISLQQQVRKCAEILSCPNCARILYHLESPVRRIAARARRTAPQKVGISRFSSQMLMIPEIASTKRDDVIAELGQLMEQGGYVDKGDRLVKEALRRESILSTATEHGLAFPHARGIEGGGLALALGISRKGIDFDGGSNSLSKIIFFMAIPTSASAFYLKLLAGLAETFSDPESRKAVMAGKTQDELWKALIKVTRKHIK